MKLVIDPDVLKGAFIEGRQEHIDFAFKIIELLKLGKIRREAAAGPPLVRLEIFVSYKSQDYEQASYIVETLEAEGHEVWFDKKRLEPGEPWDPALKKAINKSDLFLYCNSRHSSQGRNVQKEELNLALKIQGKQLSDGKYIIPVQLDHVGLPDEISGLELVDLNDRLGWTKLVEFLKDATDRLAGDQKQKEEEEKSLFLYEDEPTSKFGESRVAERYRALLAGNKEFEDWYEDVREDFSAFKRVSGVGLPAPTLLSNSCRHQEDNVFITVAVGTGVDCHLISELGIARECLQGHTPGTCPTVQRLCSIKRDKVLSVQSANVQLKDFERWLSEQT